MAGETYHFRLEANSHIRNSKQAKFPVPFPFPPSFLPSGETQGSLETVQAGEYLEFSRVTFIAHAAWSEQFHGHIKVDAIDRYDRNPTSGDQQVDIDELWLRYGQETSPDEVPTTPSWYVKLGKFGKFERQDDRNLESYGLASTTFNRFEDIGLELGVDLGSWFYVKGSYTTGNPLFMRDPNALAGDNGAPSIDPQLVTNPTPEFKSGIVLFYDAEAEWEDFSLGSDAEIGLAAGFRWSNESGSTTLNTMVFRYQRDLQAGVDLHGTFYGGDLDLLNGVGEELGLTGGLPLNGIEKEEIGINLWLYTTHGSIFAQYVDQETAGLPRQVLEIEAAWTFELPIRWAYRGEQLFSRITPTVRFSELEPDFSGNPRVYPTPSVWWEWRKLDIGAVFLIHPQLSLTLEYADNSFIRLGEREQADELLATFQFRWDSRRRR